MVTTAAIAEMGALIGDPGRANMLGALLDGRALTARELADRAGVTPQTASGHLAKLTAAGLLRMDRQGRHHYHRLASAEVAEMLEAVHVAAARMAPKGRTGPSDPALRMARSCYDHLAGALGVKLADALGDEGRISAAGEASLAEWGIELGPLRGGKRPFCKPCLDWSERRTHLAGALGAALLDHCLALGWVRRREGSRALEITPAGRSGFAARFAIDLT